MVKTPDVNEAYSEFASKVEGDKFARVSQGVTLSIGGIIPFGVPSGIPQLDYALERDGWPAGRIVELYGYEYCGKSTLALHSVAEVQRRGGVALWIDVEKAFDPERAQQLGVNTKDLWLADADSVEAIFRVCEAAASSVLAAKIKPFIMVVDSVSSVTSEYELGKEFKETTAIAGDARVIKRGVKRLNFMLSRTKAIAIFINHAMESMAAFGSPKSTGGRALKFMSSIRVEVSHKKELNAGKGDERERDGQIITIKLRKARGTPLKHPIFDINLLTSKGFDRHGSLALMLHEVGLLKFDGTHFSNADGSINFKFKDSEEAILRLGGYDKVYNQFIETAVQNGSIRKWGTYEQDSHI